MPVLRVHMGVPEAIIVRLGGVHVRVLADPECTPETLAVVSMAAAELVARAADPLRGLVGTCAHPRPADDEPVCPCEQARRWDGLPASTRGSRGVG